MKIKVLFLSFCIFYITNYLHSQGTLNKLISDSALKANLGNTKGNILQNSNVLENHQVEHPQYVVKASYFDKTPMLKNMKIIKPGSVKRNWKDDEDENVKTMDIQG